MAKTWQEKFDNGREPVVKKLEKSFGGMEPGEKMLISSPKEIDDYIKTLKKGEFIDLIQLRNDIAKKHKADGMCPLTAGIFTRIVSEVALEKMAAGNKDVTPFWRAVDPKSPLAKKLSCGPDFIIEMRNREK